jgi:AsmA protein
MRWIVGALSAVLMLGLLVVGAVALIPAEQVGRAVSAQFERFAGRALVIEGGVSPTFWPRLGVRTGPVSIANADWSEAGPMLSAEALAIDLDMAALLRGEVRIEAVEALRPVILLERARDGRENWVFGGANGGTVTSESPGAGAPFTLARGVIAGGSFRFIDHGAGTEVAVDAIDLSAAIPEFAGPVTLTASAVMNGQPFALEAEAGVFSALTEGRVVPLRATLTAGGARVAFDGRAGARPMQAEGALTADLADLRALAALAGAAAPALPAGLGAERLEVTGTLTVDPRGAVYLRGAEIVADGNRITGDLDLVPGEARPKLTARLSGGALDLSALAAGGGGGGTGAGGAAGGAGWSTAPIDVSALGLADAAVALSAESLDLGAVKLAPARATVTVDRARAVFDLAEVGAYGGRIAGQFVVNGRGGLSVGTDLTFANLSVQALTADFAGHDRIAASGNLRLKLLGVGNSVAALMSGLKGEGALTLGPGELLGIDIAAMLRTLNPAEVGAGKSTIFDAASAGFTIAEGVLSTADLRLAAPLVSATGAGQVDLGRRTLDLALRPTALPGADGTGGIMVPLVIRGPWAAPTFTLDLETLAREKMEEEAKRLEDRARAEAAEVEARLRAEAEQKLQEDLGIAVQEGESLEDAAKRRAQEVLDAEARKLLEGLLGGN